MPRTKERESTANDDIDESTMVAADVAAVLEELAAMSAEQRRDIVWTQHDGIRELVV